MKLISKVAFGVAAAVVGWSSAIACEELYVHEFQYDDAVYLAELNGVYSDHSNEPSGYSGGGPFSQWLIEGENTYRFSLTGGSATIRIKRACRGEFDGETLVEATLNGNETKELTFFVEGAPAAPYDQNEALKKKGLPKALRRFRKAVEEKNFKAYWRFIRGVRMMAEAQGFPINDMKPQLQEVIENSTATFQDDLVFKPVLGGRVWQVMTADHQSPIHIEHAEEGSGISIDTGAFWTKIDGKWRVVGM